MKTAEFVAKVMKKRRITIPNTVMELLEADVGDILKVELRTTPKKGDFAVGEVFSTIGKIREKQRKIDGQSKHGI